MKNVFTAGTEGIPLAGDPQQSVAMIPVNEDYTILVKVSACLGGLVAGTKIWDTSASPKQFIALLQYRDSDVVPPDSAVAVDSIVEFHRVGEFASDGTGGYELHTEDAAKCSWVCFVDRAIIFVKDAGNGKANRVEYESGSWVVKDTTVRAIATVEPLARFYSSTAPYAAGRIYPAVQIGETYYVFLQGFGDESKTFTATAGGIDFSLGCDSAGHVTSFSAS